MKTLSLTRRPAGKKFIYEVSEDGKVLAKRTSTRNYFGCVVDKRGDDAFYLPIFFGREDLMNRWVNDSRNGASEYYALAKM